MTGSLHHLLSLTVVSITAYIVADLLKSAPVYESLLENLLKTKNILPEKEDNTDSFYMFASAFGDRKNVKDTEDDVVYMIKKQKAAGKKFPRGYMATGVEDTHYKDNVEFMDIYEKLGVEFERTIDHGAHNWEYCNRHVKKFLDWLNINDTFKRDME